MTHVTAALRPIPGLPAATLTTWSRTDTVCAYLPVWERDYPGQAAIQKITEELAVCWWEDDQRDEDDRCLTHS